MCVYVCRKILGFGFGIEGYMDLKEGRVCHAYCEYGAACLPGRTAPTFLAPFVVLAQG